MFWGNDNGTTKHVSNLAPVHFLARTHFCHLCSNLYQTLTMSKCWCRDLGMVGPWSDNFQASCNTCTWPIEPADSHRCTPFDRLPRGILFLAPGFQTLMVSRSRNGRSMIRQFPSCICNICTCTSQAVQRAAFIDARCTQNQPAWSSFLLQKEVSEMAPGMSCSFLTVCLSVEECHPSCTFEDTARSFWSRSKPGARLKLIWFP